MAKIEITICEICGNEYKTPSGLMQHIRKKHDIKIEDYILKNIFNNNPPMCKCGCGQKVKMTGRYVADYIRFHADTGRFKNGESPKRNQQKWLKNVTKGIQEYNKKMKHTDPNYRSGENNNFYNKRHTEETKQKIRNTICSQIKEGEHPFLGNNNGRIKGSSLENKFENFLLLYNINYEKNFKISYETEHNYNRFKYYDFYLNKYNILIEIHGSYWHPKELSENLTKTQINNFHNDIFKKKLAKENDYHLSLIYDYELDEFIKNFGNSSWVSNNTDCFYFIQGERIDVPKLEVEF